MANSKHPNRDVPSVDRISVLPESLLCHILSLLPTQYAVQTSVLSKRWRNLWTCITSLDFDDELFAYPGMPPYDPEEEHKKFDQFVYRVLILLKTSFLQKFHLRCEHVCDPFLVNSWAYAALSRDVRELILTVYLPEPFEIPSSLFACKTLSCLSLDCDTTLDLPNSVCLPNLKYMYINTVKYANDETIPKLLSGCPVLEDLTLQRNGMDNVVHLSISSPTLKSLRLSFVIDVELDSPRYTLQIDAPLLEYLCLSDYVTNEFVIGNLSSLTEADISVHVSERNNEYTGYGDEVLKFINGLSNVKLLKLSCATMKALSYARGHVAPALRILTRLQGNFRCFKHKDVPWSFQPDHVPNYLLSLLTTVEITQFDGSSDELMMVKFILKGAKSLERMTIITDSHAETLLEMITKFPRVSKLCDFVVR